MASLSENLESIQTAIYGKDARKPIYESLQNLNTSGITPYLEAQLNIAYLQNQRVRSIYNDLLYTMSAVTDRIYVVKKQVEQINSSLSDVETMDDVIEELNTQAQDNSDRSKRAFEKVQNIKRKVDAPLGSSDGLGIVDENGRKIIGVVSLICT